MAITLVAEGGPVTRPEMPVMGYTGWGIKGAARFGFRFSGKPMLQVGGLQDAVITPAPGCAVETEQVLPVHPAVPPGPRAAGCDDVHVSGGLGTMQP